MLAAKIRTLHSWLIGAIIGTLLAAIVLSVAVVVSAQPRQQRSTAQKITMPEATPSPTLAYTNLAANHPIGGDFATYYQKNNGAVWLGNAISPELPDQQSIVQIFEGGLLRVGPDTQNQVVSDPLVQQLIVQGAMLPLGDSSASLSYAALASTAQYSELVPAPWWWDATKDPLVVGIFLAQTMRQGVAYGYYIPANFVPLLQKIGEWQNVIGSVLTQALNGTYSLNDVIHHYILLGFTHAVLWYDSDAQGTPMIHTQHVGNDYVAMHGFPAVVPMLGQVAWTLGSPMAINGSANGGGEVAHFLTPFSVQLAGDGKWVGHDLWLHIRWVNFLKARNGWVNADQLMLSRPANAGMQIAALDALSAQTQAAAETQGSNVTMSIYDPATDHYYVYNPNRLLEMASMFKIPILVTLLHNIEQEGRELTDAEQADLAAMIEVSDNDAEGRMYDDSGGYDSITNYMHTIGITDIQINTSGIGSTLLSPLSSVRLIEMLRSGKVLNAQHTQYALNLMANVVPSQRIGVCDTAPSGASCAMKIGYGPALNGFLMDSMGTVTYQGHVYDIAIYSAFNTDFGTGAAIIDTICSNAVAAMTN